MTKRYRLRKNILKKLKLKLNTRCVNLKVKDKMLMVAYGIPRFVTTP